jgi:preprotein translocase subunit SecY
MYRIAAIIWIMLGTTLAGIAVMIIVVVPDLAGQAMRLIPILCGTAFLLAMPLSYLIAKRIAGKMGSSA